MVEDTEIGVSPFVSREVDAVELADVGPAFVVAVLEVNRDGVSPVVSAVVVDGIEESVVGFVESVSPGELAVVIGISPMVEAEVEVMGESEVVGSVIFTGSSSPVLAEVANVEEGPTEVVDDKMTGVSPETSEVVTVEDGLTEVVDDKITGVSPETSEVVTVEDGPTEVEGVVDKRSGVSPLVGPVVVGTSEVVVSSVIFIGKVGVVLVEVVEDGSAEVDVNMTGVSPEISEVVTMVDGPTEVDDVNSTGVSPEISEVVSVVEGPGEVVEVNSTGVSPIVEAEVDVASIVLGEVGPLVVIIGVVVITLLVVTIDVVVPTLESETRIFVIG